MLFHTHEFLLLLLVTAAVYHATASARQSVLLGASLVFYAYAGMGMALLFVAVVAFNWVCYQRIGPGRGGVRPLAGQLGRWCANTDHHPWGG